jgi:hypothetical protein
LSFGWFTHKEQRQLAPSFVDEGFNLAREFYGQTNRNGCAPYRLLMISPARGDYRRCQAEIPLIGLFKFAEPALSNLCSILHFVAIIAWPVQAKANC